MKKPIVINLFAGPGAGKSTGAAYIFSQLKMAGINCELITEYAKDLTWEGRQQALSSQEYVFGKQSYRMGRCRDQVDIIITDSPLLLSWFYNNNPILDDHFKQVVLNVFNSYDNVNFWVDRKKEYNPVGRNQTEEEAKELDNQINEFLKENGLPLNHIEGTIKGYDEVVASIIDYYNLKKWIRAT